MKHLEEMPLRTGHPDGTVWTLRPPTSMTQRFRPFQLLVIYISSFQ